MDDLAWMDATAQAALVRDGEVSPAELVEAAIARIERVDPQLNAVIHPRFDAARRAAAGDADPPLPDGPFRGVPMCIKDAVAHTAGDPYHVGMRFLRDRQWTEPDDSYLAAKFREAGFVVVGKTNTPELATTITTEPVAYGPTRNPWDPTRSTGGSSGGSAAAVAAGMVPVAHGNDMGGSIRIPASECGLVGLKPTRARTSLGPNFGEFWGPTTHEGVLTRSVRDTAGVLDAIAGMMPGDPYTAPPPLRPFVEEVGADPGSLRIGVHTLVPRLATPVHPDCATAVTVTADLLDDLGHDVARSFPAALDEPIDDALLVYAAFVARDLERWEERTGTSISAEDVEGGNWLMASFGRELTATRYLASLEAMQAWSRRMARWWADDGWDLLLMPVLPDPPPMLGQDPFALTMAQANCCIPWNLTGQPAISLPLHWNGDGLPIGVQLVAPFGREDVLLRVAAQLETARPWADRRPPIHA